MNRQSAGEFLAPLKINIMCFEVSWIFNVSFLRCCWWSEIGLNVLRRVSFYVYIYLWYHSGIADFYFIFLNFSNSCLMRQIWSHTFLQVSKCLRMNLLSWFSTLTFAFLFSAKVFFQNVLLLEKKAWKHNNKYISGAGSCASLQFPAFLRLNGGSAFTLVADNSVTPDRVLKKKRKQSRPGSQN